MNSRIIPYQIHRYHQQKRFGWCGMYTLKNIIESFQEEIDLTIHDYAPTFWNKISWFMLPYTVIKVLQKHWFTVNKWRHKQKWFDNKISFLKNLLLKWPVILVIWHAYKSKKQFSLIKAVSVQHYISLRWYNDQDEVFYVYDSWTPSRLIRKDLPIWNIAIKYKDIIKYRKFWWFLLKNYFYIHVDYKIYN